MNSDWEPIDRVKIDANRTYEAMWPSGLIDTRTGNTICSEEVVAVRDVTPKPKRREWAFDNCGLINFVFTGPVLLREVLPNDPAPEILDAIAKLHQNKTVGQHWLITAIERIAVGEPEVDVMRDYGYVRIGLNGKRAVSIARHMKNAAWLERFKNGIVQGSPFVGENIARDVHELLDAILE